MILRACIIAVIVITKRGVSSALLEQLDVPQFTFLRGSATLRCAYNMRHTTLYSLKWYHNNTEFYRYVPTERNGPVNIGPTNNFNLHEVSRDDSQVTLLLGDLKSSATGKYTCEVLADHPSFRTSRRESFMKVLSERLSPPRIIGIKSLYEPSDLITIGCEPQRDVEADPRPKIKWFIDGREVAPRFLAKYGHTHDGKFTGVSLNIPGQLILDSGGSVQVDCKLRLGNFEEKSTKILRVRMEHHSLAVAPSEGQTSFVPQGPSLFLLLMLIFTLI